MKTISKSNRRWWRPLVSIGCGLLCSLFFLTAMIWGGQTAFEFSRMVSDAAMLREGGPRLGARELSGKVVLVSFGEASAERMGKKPDIETDRKLYQQLIDADAKVVADLRNLVCTDPADFEANVRPTLDLIQEVAPNGNLARDVFLTLDVDYEVVGSYRDCIVHHGMSFRSPTMVNRHSRIFPIAMHDYFALRETFPFWVVQRLTDQPNGGEVGFYQRLDRAGLIQQWMDFFPEMENLLQLSSGEEAITPNPIQSDYQVGDQEVSWIGFGSEFPTVSPAGVWVDYGFNPGELTRLEYGDLADGDFDPELVRGKAVLIDMELSFVPASDRYDIPIRDRQADALEVTGVAIETLLNGVTMRLAAWYVSPALLFGFSIFACVIAASFRARWALLGVGVLLLAYLAICTFAFRGGWFLDMAFTPVSILVAGVLGVGIRYFEEIRWRQRITDLFGRYVPRAVVNQLVQQSELQAIVVGGVTREVTVMFADIRGFTQFSERLQPEDVLEELNGLLEVMVRCTFEEEGTVDKFIGDAILVLFNAPLDQTDHAERACRVAWRIQEALRSHESGLSIGIGIHTGKAVVGNVGTPQRMEYTAIGNTVNVASRLCDRALAGEIVVSGEVSQQLSDSFVLEANEPMQVKGIAESLATSRLVGFESVANE
ncbi:adenylate/guanylate cyclase domain-containing protein [Rhodopirellula bahusiensis]|uniref:Adenylate/guanylate cyclase domain-containing protein n=1 Tax=Rhodopirellula bahusiensis TaxID=2014065 RepID=A0A2G1W8D9_9BACT|nr:adenylate/guanylate cyclase domain-containing protein [Rhodopirellula bahusiensis]PHQ35278.1 adenylate/guanylate cyclase domain-containing protein [Rhodopirellula bahusiensis]